MIRFFVLALALLSMGASHRTPNFVVTAYDARFAQAAAETAERYRRELAIEWLGQELPTWSAPCPISITAGPNLGNGGATSFVFQQGEVVSWNMNIQGTPERLLDAVIPHEVTHTIFASHFRRPLPRWADEGACTTVESEPELAVQRQAFDAAWRGRRCLTLPQLFAVTQYNEAPIDVLYAQGWSVAQFLVNLGGRPYFVAFIGAGMSGGWANAVRDYYGYNSVNELQSGWNSWVAAGSPAPETHVAAYQQGGLYWTGREYIQRGGGCLNGQCAQPTYSAQPMRQQQPTYAQPSYSAPAVPVAKPPASAPALPQPPPPTQTAKGCQCTGEGKCECSASDKCDCGDVAGANAKTTELLVKLVERVEALEKRECEPCKCEPVARSPPCPPCDKSDQGTKVEPAPGSERPADRKPIYYYIKPRKDV